MNQKTRGYTGLTVCSVLVGIVGGLYALGAFVNFTAILATPQDVESVSLHLMGAGISLGLSLLFFSLSCLLRLAVHVADDLYMLRLIAVNAYSRLPKTQLP